MSFDDALGGVSLALRSISQVLSPAALLQMSCLPRGAAARLRSLQLSFCGATLPEELPRIPPLEALTELALSVCAGPLTLLEALWPSQLLEGLLAAAPGLQSLSCAGCFRQELPTYLVSRRGLSSLELKDNRVSDLPAGPYLSSECHWLGCWRAASFLLCSPWPQTAMLWHA